MPAAEVQSLFRDVMARFPAAVCVLSTADDDHVAAMTATAVMSYSASPPSMLCSIDHAAQSHRLLETCDRFAINVLHHEQSETALAFARSESEKFARDEFVRGAAFGMPVIADALATLVCAREATHSHFDHTLLIGRVIDGRLDAGRRPLLYAERTFWQLTDAASR